MYSLMVFLMHSPYVLLMHHVKVALNWFFIVENLTAFRAHVPSLFSLAFIRHAQEFTSNLNQNFKSDFKIRGGVFKDSGSCYLFYSCSCSFPSRINSRTRGPPLAPPLLPASLTDILPFSVSSLFCLLDKPVTSIFWSTVLEHNELAWMNCS